MTTREEILALNLNWPTLRDDEARKILDLVEDVQRITRKAALAEAERLCREQVRRDTMIHGPVLCRAYCHQQDADAIAKLKDVEAKYEAPEFDHPWRDSEDR